MPSPPDRSSAARVPSALVAPAEAERLIRENVAMFGTEECPLAEAHGRVLRAPLHADRDLPPFDRVTMDGYALRASALTPERRIFRVEATQAAGMRPFRLSAADDACIEIMTGAVLPDGADCVVPYEETARAGDAMTVRAAMGNLPPGGSIHRRGSDHRAGEVIVPGGRRISGNEIAVAAATGAAWLTVAQRPKIAVVATGDELVEASDPVAPHQVRRSNDHAMRAALLLAGFSRVERFHCRDVRSGIEHQLSHILAEFDVVLITGGVSKGKFDFLPAELDAQGVKRVFHGVAQRPGKPFWFGLTATRKPVFALPGNPVSAYTCLHRYVLPALAEASGCAHQAPPLVALASAVDFRPPLAWLLPVKLADGTDGTQRAVPDPTNTSGDFSGLIGTDGFVQLPPGPAAFPAGCLAPFYPWT